MKFSLQSLVTILFCAVLGPMLGGCGCKQEIVSRDIRVTLDDDVRGKPVQIDFYAATPAEEPSWVNVPVDSYFKDSNTMRSSNPNKGTLTFEPGSTEATAVFPAGNRVWDAWKQRGGFSLVILAYIPGSAGSWTGEPRADPRRQVIPLDACLWDKPGEPIRIQVHPGFITVDSRFRTTPR